MDTLPDSVLLTVLGALGARDLAALVCTCRRLRSLVNQQDAEYNSQPAADATLLWTAEQRLAAAIALAFQGLSNGTWTDPLYRAARRRLLPASEQGGPSASASPGEAAAPDARHAAPAPKVEFASFFRPGADEFRACRTLVTDGLRIALLGDKGAQEYRGQASHASFQHAQVKKHLV